MATEWVEARGSASEADEDFHDRWGQGIDPGHIGILLGGGVVIEGTREEVLDLLRRMTEIAERATPQEG